MDDKDVHSALRAIFVEAGAKVIDLNDPEVTSTIEARDVTEADRRERIAEINADPAPPEGETWTTDELTRDFEVLGFMAPYVVVRRRSDGAKGSLEFRHSPRIYFAWTPVSATAGR